MNKHKPTHRILALMLSIFLVLGMSPVTVAAEAPPVGEVGEIIAFEALSEKAKNREVALGTSLADVTLPDTLSATVLVATATDLGGSGEPGVEERILPVPVTWQAEPEYDGETADTYTFTAQIGGAYTLAGGVEAPQIIVTVREEAPPAGGEITAFDPLDEDIAQQAVPVGTPLSGLVLPGTLAATVDGKAAPVPVANWTSEPEYKPGGEDEEPSEYIFTPQLGEGFSLAAGVSAPTITVSTVLGRGLLNAGAPVDITNKTVTEIQDAIEVVLASATSVAVTGSKTGVDSTLTLTIPTGKTVVWAATFEAASSFSSSLISLYDDGAFEVITGGTVSTTAGVAIDAIGTGSAVTVSGGTVSAPNGNAAIYATGAVTVSGGTVGTGTGYAIYASGASSAVTVSGTGRVEATATTGKAIGATGANATVTVSGGLVTGVSRNVNSPVIYMSNTSNTGLNVTVSGTGKVEATGNNGHAIRTAGSVEVKENAEVSATTAIYATGVSSAVTVSGGTVSATTGPAIYAGGASAIVTVSGGVVFAHRRFLTGSNGMIYLSNNPGGFTGATGTGVVIAWNAAANNHTYQSRGTQDIATSPADAAYWYNDSEGKGGIAYQYGADSAGFIPLTGVTVTKITLAAADFAYTDPTTLNHTYNGSAQDIGTVTLKSPHDSAFNGTTGGTLAVHYNGSATVPTDADTYAVTAEISGGTEYEACSISLGSYTITPKPLTITGVTAPNKGYNGTNAVALTGGTLNGVVSGDTGNVGFTLGTGSTVDKNVGNGKAVTTDIRLTGSAAGNYTLTQPAGITVNISEKALNIISATVQDKEYDGTTDAIVTGVELGGLVVGETLDFGTDYTATGLFTDANIGTGKAVIVAVTLKPTPTASNYSVSSTKGTTASITARQIGGAVTIDVTNGSGDAMKVDEGDTLTANISDITPGGATLAYQWYRDGESISGETASTYTVAGTATDPGGSHITVTVTGTGNYAGSKTSGEVEIGRIPIGGSISVSGTTAVGDTLTMNTAAITPAGAVYVREWLRNGTVISGETSATYVITKNDLGKTITARITGTDEYSGERTANIDIPAVVPEAPSLSTNAGNGQVRVNWSAPWSGGSAILKYEFSSDNGASWTDVGLVTTYTVTGLANGTSYTFKVRAVNSVGTGAEASVSATPTSGGGGGGTGGGGSSSGNDGGSGITVTPPAADKPNTPTQGEIKITGTVDGNGNAAAGITEKAVSDAYEKALAEAKKNGNAQNGITLVLAVNTGRQTVNSLSFNLPKAVQEFIISKGIVNTVVVVDHPDITIGMDLATVKEINRQAGSDVNITATRMNNNQLTGSARTAIGSRPVFDLGVSYGGKAVQSFGAGSVSVAIPYTLGANEKAGNVQAVYVDANGKVQWLVSSVYDSVNKVLRFSTSHFSAYGVGYKQDAPAFTDVGGHWAKNDIAFVANRGLFSGTSATTFSPNTAMTRGMFVTALGRLANADVSAYKQSSFTDVKNDAYYIGYIEWASKNGIVSGTGNGKFTPDQSITREQMAVIMANYAKTIGFTLPKVHVENTFADNAKISAYAKDAVKQMQMAGVISGKNGNLFDPQGTATRAEVSAVLRRFVELAISSDTAQGWTMNDSGKWMYYENGKPVTGTKDIDGSTYSFDGYGVTADVPKNLRYTTYIVQKGDSFWLIARKLDCTMSELERLNNKTRFSIIYLGDVLRVPEK